MAKRLAIPSKELQLHVVGPKNVFKASRVQRFNLGTEVPSTTVDEIGNPLHVGDSKDVPNVTLTFSAFDAGIKIFSVLTGTDADAYPAAGVDISELAEMDAIIYVKSDSGSDYAKSAHARKMQIRDFAFNYTVDGEATEDYTAVGSEKRWLKYDVVVDRFLTGTTSFTLTQTPIQLKNGKYALSVKLDGAYLEEVSTAPATGEYRIVGTTLTTGDSRTSEVIAVYHANPVGDNWSDVSDPLLPAAIKGKDINILIAANDIPRVQSVTINGNMNVQAVKELGNKTGIAGYQRQVPTVEGTITVLDTDTELMSLFSYGTTTSGVEWTPGEGCAENAVALEIQLEDPCDTDAPYTIVKTIYVPNITIVGDSFSSTVNQNATQTFNWKSTDAQCIIFSGAR